MKKIVSERSKGSNSKIYPYILHHSSISTPINVHFHYLSAEEDSNRLINMERSAEVFNEVLQLHMQETQDCTRLFEWNMVTEERCGLGTRLAMPHKICTYVSKWYNLYKEVSTFTR